jgi:phospholipid-translocating ATPase
LVLALSQFIPALSVGLLVSYISPIIIVLGLSMVKELWDYFKTLKKDAEYNNELFVKLSPNLQKKSIKSKDIKVGDFIILQKNQRVPVSFISLYHLGGYGSSSFLR